ncbi:maintenance of telomere capping protein 2 [Zygosaccharomyces mellis]|uniref:Maintenance of telomere capping protein 2 n=1 Tax=Zygosaccharomyces mellis TaxID=42258 RepID=A0A4C2DZ40_9SACH|nr:maintenance of telomere capping protein 2 [Zygosaccharomyces mellis]
MAVGKLPDFISCLRFMMAAKKHLMYFYSVKEPDSPTSEQLEIERQAALLRNIVERLYLSEGVSCYVLKNIPQEELPTSSDQTHTGVEVIIIPQVHKLSKDEQNVLVRMMRSSQVSRPVRLFVGMISWNTTKESAMSGNIELALSSRITSEDWLKHKFWFASYEPNENELFSPLTETTSESIGGEIQYTDVHVNRSIHRYILDIMIHLRMHKLVDTTKGGGIHTSALKDVLILSQLIALCRFKKRFVTPEHVKLACIWYFPLHIEILKGSTMDASVLYGSRPELVEGMLKCIADVKLSKTVETENPLFLETVVVQDVLNRVVPPV